MGDNMSKLVDVENLIFYSLVRNYARWPSTFSTCPTEGCERLGRGGGLCADCIEKELAGLIGENLAKQMHDSIKRTHELWCIIFDELEDDN